MSYFDIIPSDDIFNIFCKLNYKSFKSLYQAYKLDEHSHILATYNNDNMWYHILCTAYPHFRILLCKMTHASNGYKHIYYYYRDNHKGARRLLHSANTGISSSIQKGVGPLKFMPNIISKLWLFLAYPYVYEKLINIADTSPIEHYHHDAHFITIDRSWVNILGSISYFECLCEKYPNFQDVISYLMDGVSIPSDLIIENVFNKSVGDSKIFAIIWLLSIDPKITISKNYIISSLKIGIKLKHIDGIRFYLAKLNDVNINYICSIYKAPIAADVDKIESLLEFITLNIDILIK